jgi:hypothetical protein
MDNLDSSDQTGQSQFPEASLTRPRTDVSFFQEPDSEYISQAKPSDLLDIIKSRPFHEGRFIHELWRSGRYSTIAEMVGMTRVSEGRVSAQQLIHHVIQGFTLDFTELNQTGKTEAYLQFISESITCMLNGGNYEDFNNSISENNAEWIVKIINIISSGTALSSISNLHKFLDEHPVQLEAKPIPGTGKRWGDLPLAE